MKKKYLLITLIFIISISFGQNLPNDCQNYIQACDNQSVSFNVSGAGIQEINPPSCSSQENNSLWLRVTIDQPGTLGFTIIPQSNSINEDYDFWVFGPASNCGNLGTPIRCSTTNPAAAGQPNNHTGLSANATDTSEGPGADGNSFVSQLNVLSGQSYFVVIDRPIGSSPFSLNWSGTATILNPFANLNLPNFPNVILCDEGADNSEPYDFSVLDAAYLASLPGFSITYFASLQDASLNNNPLISSTAISQGTYYARISSDSAQCTEIKTVQVLFNNLATNDVTKTVCENTVMGTVNYDLSSHNNEIYTGNQIVTYSYYTSLIDATNTTNSIANWQNISLAVGNHVFYIRTEKGTCFDISELSIEVYARPVINDLVSLKQCDDDTDGFSAFNLTEANELITNNPAGLTIAYFLTLSDAQNNTNPIINNTNFVNQTVNVQTIYYRVSNDNNCFKTGQLDLTVAATQIPATFNPLVFISCDTTFGTNNDGIATFDFSTAITSISNLFTGQVVEVTFYENLNDALAEINAITNIANFNNLTSPTTQDIYVRVDSDVNNDCVGLGKYVTLQVEPIPIVLPKLVRGCDDNQDGIFDFDTTTIESELLNGLTNVVVTYTDVNNTVYNALPNPFSTNSQVLNVTITNATVNACSYTTTLEFIVDQAPVFNPVNSSLLIQCDDELDPLLQDGVVIFNTSNFENTIIGNQTNVAVEYYDINNNLLPNFIGSFETGTQDVLVKVIHLDNSNCFATGILSFVVYSNPKIMIDAPNEIICTDNPNAFVILDAGLENPTNISDYSYQWYFENQAISGASQYTYTANTTGNYTVVVTNSNGCSSTRNSVVNPSNIAIIDDIEIDDLVDSNTITVLISGDGDYQFSIDGENYQDSNIFYDVQPGLLSVWVYDKNGCGISNKEISVLGVPKFFTPNGDGFNDFWNIKGFNERFGNQTVVSIFDRYGKLLKQISSLSQGWDGTFNGVKMPAADYWYTINMLDGRVQKGHFSLKR
ncbi:T9SS type B sorting domain-containing protein [Flavobacterium sp. J27]|uniref:T9SS type B sorting domain-containing protein n=1 Tax=Flavobacterium sp. J27 TaxID=2060419 RepID=UPI001031BCCF|nr:T9SS type B sorting domain-containing protein [Flavobacterium sp. J27]